jgi:hypothetical protein
MQIALNAAVRMSWAVHQSGQYKWRTLPTFLLILVRELGAVSHTDITCTPYSHKEHSHVVICCYN